MAPLPASLLLPLKTQFRAPSPLHLCPDHLWNGDCLPTFLPTTRWFPQVMALSSPLFTAVFPTLGTVLAFKMFMVSGPAASAPPGACEKCRKSSSTQTYRLSIVNLTRSLGNSGPHSSLRCWMRWREKHVISICGIYLKKPVFPAEVLSPPAVQSEWLWECKPFTLSPLPWGGFLRWTLQSSVAYFHVPTTYTYSLQRNHNLTWKRAECTKESEDISLKCGWPYGKLA